MTECGEIINTGRITTIDHMFKSCSKLTTAPKMDTNNVTNMNNMFAGCSSLTSVPEMDTSNVTITTGMFISCPSLTSVPQMDTSKVTNMRSMFSGCTNLPTVPQLDTRNVTDLDYLFLKCTSLVTLNILNLGTYKSLTSIDFSSCPWVNGLYDSLYTNSFDRAASNYSSCTLKLSTISKDALTDDQKAAITAKGYTIS